MRAQARTGSSQICAEVAGYRAEGFSAVKLKIGFDVDDDAALVDRVRQTIGPDMDLMLDANHGFDAIDAIDYLQPDTCAAGGLSECKKIADMANAFGVRTVPHVWGTGIGLSAALQLLAVLPHNPPGRQPWEPLLEFDRSEHPARQAIMTQPIEHRDGIVSVPTGPGLGIEIDRKAIDSFRADR